MTVVSRLGRMRISLTSVAAVCVCLTSPLYGQSLPSPFAQVVAAEASAHDEIAAFYKETGYQTLWTGEADVQRRAALLNTLARAGDHALPFGRYDVRALTALLTAAQTEGDRARAEVALSMAFAQYARDIRSGVLQPKSIDATIVREIARPDIGALLLRMTTEDPMAVLHGLAPKSPQYAQLMRAKIDLGHKIARGGWGPAVKAKALVPGDSGAAVVSLRDRLIAMGYLGASATQTYDAVMQAAVQRFQLDHGLIADGHAYAGTIDAMNISPEERQRSVIVAMERMRWMGDSPLGDRHIWVNLPDFTAKIVDHGKVTFETRAVIGKNVPDQRTPEFSDTMEHMVINPSWGVPRSIIVNEYLPLLQRNPNAVSHLQVIDGAGRVVSRGAVNFAAYSARTFPFGLRQPPSDSNALGKVKFMFPNVHNIYLHDTPAKNLFSHDVRAYSHGCIRLADPIDFAHAILAVQSDDPEGQFDAALKTKQETTVKLKETIPVHLVYFTAYPGARGQMTYRRDIYGRDAELARALEAAGVVTPRVQG